MRIFFVFLVGATFLISCQPSVKTVNYEIDGSSGATCELDVYSEGLTISEDFKVIGEIEVRDTGFSLNCGKEVVMSKIKNEACAVEANAIQMFDVVQPSWWGSTCFQANARFIKY